ncbi:hypothetical protein DLE54_11860 (plasmid) [Psychrobacter sp. YP14]|uniref:hypothetical protein n=1 Tax=Psychrobacter sp. YP14 TaxID=2203895 RepID=UPI000D7DE27D|nr:hypothetical protein [Psychrobacter sp. YP14]AWT50317.1 hypothetical protein DLE54_11860 [Psychrobacter sp. YP14]
MSESIFDNQEINDLKERQQLEELKRKARLKKVKLDKRVNKQKILMGAFLGQVLSGESEEEKFIQNYFAKNFPKFLTRKLDKELFASMVKSLGGDIGLDEEASKANDQLSEKEEEQVEQPDDTDYTDDDIRELFSDPQIDALAPHDNGYRG